MSSDERKGSEEEAKHKDGEDFIEDDNGNENINKTMKMTQKTEKGETSNLNALKDPIETLKRTVKTLRTGGRWCGY